jgi:hypothetical protein
MPDDYTRYVFISYKHRDEKTGEAIDETFAHALRDRLTAWNMCSWMDCFDIKAGAHWPDAIHGGIESVARGVGRVITTRSRVAQR